MIEIQYCASCGDKIIVDKIEKQLEGVDEVQKVECGSCNMKVKADEEQVFNEEEDILDIKAIRENAKKTIET